MLALPVKPISRKSWRSSAGGGAKRGCARPRSKSAAQSQTLASSRNKRRMWAAAIVISPGLRAGPMDCMADALFAL